MIILHVEDFTEGCKFELTCFTGNPRGCEQGWVRHSETPENASMQPGMKRNETNTIC